MSDEPKIADKDFCIGLGYSNEVAEAIEGQEITESEVLDLSPEDAFQHYLQWNGIIGYTSSIIRALENCRTVG